MIRARKLRAVPAPSIVSDPALVDGYLEDASGAAPGVAAGLVRVTSEAEAASFLRVTEPDGLRVLVQAARSSLTGGAVPCGEVVLTTERLTARGAIERDASGARLSVEPGIRLVDLQRSLAREGFYYPPVPTYQEAMIGGSVSTNAGGAASFKYGVTRDWVEGLRVLLFNGDCLMLERGQAEARPGGHFAIGLSDGKVLRVPAPTYRLPRLKKISAGYHAADPLDLVDLFVGSEGTLGMISEVTIRVVPLPASVVSGLVFTAEVRESLRLAAALRRTARCSREGADASHPDVRSIEMLDGNCLDLLRHGGVAADLRIAIPPQAGSALVFEMELPEVTTDERSTELLEGFLEGRAKTEPHPLLRLFATLRDHEALEHLEFAFPEDSRRREAFARLREAVPKRVGEILATRRLEDPAVRKVGGDLVVPFDELEAMLGIYESGFRSRGLEFAVWGHLSDGNLHPNALPRNAREVEAGVEALLEFGDEAVRRGGSPLSEHGVGRSAVKQQLLRRFLGSSAVDEMRAIKAALDPRGRFAPGVLFPA